MSKLICHRHLSRFRPPCVADSPRVTMQVPWAVRRCLAVVLLTLLAFGFAPPGATSASQVGQSSELVGFTYDTLGSFAYYVDTAAGLRSESVSTSRAAGRRSGAATGRFYDSTADLVGPRPRISLGRFADDTFYDVIPTRGSDLEVLAEVSVSGRTLTLSDIAVYGADGDLVNEVGGPALVGIRKALATEAADAGFDPLRLIGVRVSTNSSANPGHVIDRAIDLERFRR